MFVKVLLFGNLCVVSRLTFKIKGGILAASIIILEVVCGKLNVLRFVYVIFIVLNFVWAI